MIVELPGLRQGVRALRVPRGLLLHDPLRWRLFSAPADLPADKLRDFLRRNGLDAGTQPPARRPRLRQVFWVGMDQIPQRDLRIRPGARFACVCCGTSCQSMKFGPMEAADVERLLHADWSETSHDPRSFFVDRDDQPIEARAEGVQPFLRRIGTVCQFLREDNLCEVHARFGAQAKPLMCRMFPYVYRATPAGIAVGMRLGECISAKVTSRGLPVLEQHGDLERMLAEHQGLPLVPPSVWTGPDGLIPWEEYERIETRLLELPPQSAAGGFAAAVVRAFEPASAGADGLEELMLRAGISPGEPRQLDPAAVDLEDRFCRSMVFGKELFLPQDLSRAAALLLIKCHVARVQAADGTPEALNHVWKAAAERPLRDLCDGLDLRGIAARIAS